MTDDEARACTPLPVKDHCFNPHVILPYGLEVEHVRRALHDFVDFLGFINVQLSTRQTPRLETMLMSANFSSIVGEYMSSTIPKYCTTLAKNRYHNGHPDLIPVSAFANNEAQYGDQGIEIKSSRYPSGWQGHNPERVWLMVFVFNSDSARDIQPKPFRFTKIVGAQLEKEDWSFSGRSATSRRTITASVTKSGHAKLRSNWLYDASIIEPFDKRQLGCICFG